MLKKYDSVPKKRLLWPKNLDGSQNSWGAQTEPFGFIPHLVESAVQQIRGILEYVVNSFSFASIRVHLRFFSSFLVAALLC